MGDNKSNRSEITLGTELRRHRIRRHETLLDASEAVEITSKTLSQIEHGIITPEEDILSLLVSHYELDDKQATKLWELAGYDNQDQPLLDLPAGEVFTETKPGITINPADAKIIYTDMVHVMINNFGVVVNFLQGSGPSNQSIIVSRVGMSRDHAKSLLEVLKKTLEQSEPKTLPSPKSRKKPRTSKD